MPLLADRTTPDGLRVVAASGELDRTDLPYVRNMLTKAFAEGESVVVLDMSEVTYIDSTILAGLISESLDADKRDATLAIVTGTAGILRSLELKGLIQVMHIWETLEEAAAELAAEPPAH